GRSTKVPSRTRRFASTITPESSGVAHDAVGTTDLPRLQRLCARRRRYAIRRSGLERQNTRRTRAGGAGRTGMWGFRGCAPVRKALRSVRRLPREPRLSDIYL